MCKDPNDSVARRLDLSTLGRARCTRGYRTIAHSVIACPRSHDVSDLDLENADAIAGGETTHIVILARVVVAVREERMHLAQ